MSFCKRHLPDKDTTITLEDEYGKEYKTKYIACKTGLSAGWRQFSAVHKLLEGDVVVLQLIEPTKFKVIVFIFIFIFIFIHILFNCSFVSFNFGSLLIPFFFYRFI